MKRKKLDFLSIFLRQIPDRRFISEKNPFAQQFPCKISLIWPRQYPLYKFLTKPNGIMLNCFTPCFFNQKLKGKFQKCTPHATSIIDSYLLFVNFVNLTWLKWSFMFYVLIVFCNENNPWIIDLIILQEECIKRIQDGSKS